MSAFPLRLFLYVWKQHQLLFVEERLCASTGLWSVPLPPPRFMSIYFSSFDTDAVIESILICQWSARRDISAHLGLWLCKGTHTTTHTHTLCQMPVYFSACQDLIIFSTAAVHPQCTSFLLQLLSFFPKTLL